MAIVAANWKTTLARIGADAEGSGNVDMSPMEAAKIKACELIVLGAQRVEIKLASGTVVATRTEETIHIEVRRGK